MMMMHRGDSGCTLNVLRNMPKLDTMIFTNPNAWGAVVVVALTMTARNTHTPKPATPQNCESIGNIKGKINYITLSFRGATNASR